VAVMLSRCDRGLTTINAENAEFNARFGQRREAPLCLSGSAIFAISAFNVVSAFPA
jgi:hypothetical protein